MNPDAVMVELGERLATIADHTSHDWPVGSPTPPASLVSYPETGTFDLTYQRGMDRLTIPIVVIMGQVKDRATREQFGAYTAGSGARSVKAVLESGTYVSFHEVVVKGFESDAVRIGAVDHMAAIFTCEVTGSGE